MQSPRVNACAAMGPNRRLAFVHCLAQPIRRSVAAFCCIVLWQHVAPAIAAAPTRPTFSEWTAKCAALPTNRRLQGRVPPTKLLPLAEFADLESLIDDFFRLCQRGPLATPDAWLGNVPDKTFFDPSRGYFSDPRVPFAPYVQKLVVPGRAEIVLNGDLHGDLHSLLGRLRWLNERRYLDGFQITNTNVFLVFLGDYADRGMYGLEVFYTLLRLKLASPQQVLLGRGNHEDLQLALDYGLVFEGQEKYGRRFNPEKVARFFDFLPVALYLGTGTNYVQCSHAGVEPGFDPGPLLDAPASARFQLLGELRRKKFSDHHPDLRRLAGRRASGDYDATFQDFRPASPTLPYPLGFLWTDFTIVHGEPGFRFDPGRGAVYGEETTRFILNALSGTNGALRGIVRAHQHSSIPNPIMRRLVASRGVFQHWQTGDSSNQLHAPVSVLARRLETEPVRPFPHGSVWTFNVSPDSVYGSGCNFDFDAFGILAVAPDFSAWRLRVVNPVTR